MVMGKVGNIFGKHDRLAKLSTFCETESMF